MHDFVIEHDRRVASAQQRAFWLANEVEPGTPAFNLLRVLRIEGVLHNSVLANALDDIVARHEILRTSLFERDGVVMQRVHARLPFVLEERDLRSLSERNRSMQANALACGCVRRRSISPCRIPGGARALSRTRAPACDRFSPCHHRWVVDGIVLQGTRVAVRGRTKRQTALATRSADSIPRICRTAANAIRATHVR